MCAIFVLNRYPGFSTTTEPKWEGYYSEYMLVPPYRGLVNLKDTGLDPEKAAPLSDAALTPYHSIKMVKRLIGLGSMVDSDTTIDLSDVPVGKTDIIWIADAHVGGLIASVGQRLLEWSAEQTVNQLFEPDSSQKPKGRRVGSNAD